MTSPLLWLGVVTRNPSSCTKRNCQSHSNLPVAPVVECALEKAAQKIRGGFVFCVFFFCVVPSELSNGWLRAERLDVGTSLIYPFSVVVQQGD
ncbi:hypothetical protein CEXT_93391 [Caerostris extrusa]|uniref:Secreted protein n=1 Tax=Caerostris extrusa TaxID=172846 RepID=A0AAV4U2B3_CAEEX|nr:hypothetical protein CEXT_93391 [Caerostris extrusa]